MDWIGLNKIVTDKSGHTRLVTDDMAREYGANKFGVPEDQVVVERDGAIIRIKPQEAGPMSFNAWLHYTYGEPVQGSKYYYDYMSFGYRVWLIKEYPEIFAESGLTHMEIWFWQNVEYKWYLLEYDLECPLEEDLSILEEDLIGAPIVDISKCPSLNWLGLDSAGILYAEDLYGAVMVIAIDEDGDLIPIDIDPMYMEMIEDVYFDGFDDE